VSGHVKLWQKDAVARLAAPSPPSSVDSGQTTERERLTDFDDYSTGGDTTEEELDVTNAGNSSFGAAVCV